jgi:hypothetical protein
MTTAFHQLDVSYTDTLPVTCRQVTVPKAVQTSLLGKGPSFSTQESLNIIGAVTKHTNSDAAVAVANDLLTRTSCKYTLFCEQTSPAVVHRVSPVPSNVVMRDAGDKGPLTSLTVEQFRDVFNDAASNGVTWAVASLDQNTTIEDVPNTQLPYVMPHCGEKRSEIRYHLSAGVPKSGTLSGAPMVIIDRYGGADYVVYAIWALVTFEGVYIESGMVNASAMTGFLSGGAQPASYLGAVSTVLGLVETVVHVVHTLVRELNVSSFALVDTAAGKRNLISEDSALDKVHVAAIQRMMARYQASRTLNRTIRAKPKAGKAKPRKMSGRNTKPRKRLGK